MSQQEQYHPQTIEAHWQKKWAEHELFATDNSTSSSKKFYVLEMFPYPSGRIHMGHVRNYTLGDVVARIKMMQGYHVLHPIGWDGFGLPAENAAKNQNSHPQKWTYDNITTMRTQLKRMGFSYDWHREIATCHPEYYRHEQKMFLDFLKNDLVYRKESIVNWDPVEQSVLANEQVIDGRGWRSGAEVQPKKLKQWFMRITNYSEELLLALENLTQWPSKVKHMQHHWIGKNIGASITFHATTPDHPPIEVFTTRPDTLFGASFIAIAAAHPLAQKVAEQDPSLRQFIKEQSQKTQEDQQATMEKKGHKTEIYYQHPFKKNETLPLYVANFVLMEYGTGAVFGCPAHDERDYEFAQNYHLPITPVIQPPSDSIPTPCWTGDGILINSDFLNGLSIKEAKKKMIEMLEHKNIGRAKTSFRLRDWCVSRQRYWGCPIPVVYCDACGIVPCDEQTLPITLPIEIDFKVTGNPLSHNEEWLHVPCPSCGASARRESDTLDTFFESSWYFARFISPRADTAYEEQDFKKFMPVDLYIGGVEHAVMHLLYARFFMRALRDCGYPSVDEPFSALLTQGMVCHKSYQNEDGTWILPQDVITDEAEVLRDKDGRKVTEGRMEKMSKSKMNVIDPDDIIHVWGADVARLFILSDSPPDRDLEWSDEGVRGTARFLKRLWRMVIGMVVVKVVQSSSQEQEEGHSKEQDKSLKTILHCAIHDVGQTYAQYQFNRSVAFLHGLTHAIESHQAASPAVRREAMITLLQLLHPMTPHITEELYSRLGHDDFLCRRPFPQADPTYLIKERVTLAIQINGKLRGQLEVAHDCDEATALGEARHVVNVAKHLEGQSIKRVVFVKNRLLNMLIE